MCFLLYSRTHTQIHNAHTLTCSLQPHTSHAYPHADIPSLPPSGGRPSGGRVHGFTEPSRCTFDNTPRFAAAQSMAVALTGSSSKACAARHTASHPTGALHGGGSARYLGAMAACAPAITTRGYLPAESVAAAQSTQCGRVAAAAKCALAATSSG